MVAKDRSLAAALMEAGEQLYVWTRGDREKRCRQRRESYYRTREKSIERTKQHRLRYKEQAFKHYGGKCKCCGEDFPPFLALDHINGDGAKQRGNSGGGNFYVRVVKDGFPTDLQILCHNCNIAKGTKISCPCPQRKIGL